MRTMVYACSVATSFLGKNKLIEIVPDDCDLSYVVAVRSSDALSEPVDGGLSLGSGLGGRVRRIRKLYPSESPPPAGVYRVRPPPSAWSAPTRAAWPPE